ncbi:MAG: type I restriction enzyme HsdR N-terminal domain-containing protein [Marinilabiliales bacterium]|nr:type I restriction enzyme HsdR N-terminal domain-containing protein [Marinilabiliales bacterium]
MEVIPEYVCDIGTKKGEKIDYAIFKEGQPIILIECKHWAQKLDLHDNQLLRYFHVSKAKFGILANGIKYKFYADLEAPIRWMKSHLWK